MALQLITPIPSRKQETPFKKASLTNRIEIDGNIDYAWNYLSDLGNLQYLVPSTIQKSVATNKGKGSRVTLTLLNQATIIEEVVVFNPKKRCIEYIMVSTPLPIKNYRASFTLHEIADNRFEVVFTASYKVQESNRKQREEAFEQLQKELLQNIKKITLENQ